MPEGQNNTQQTQKIAKDVAKELQKVISKFAKDLKKQITQSIKDMGKQIVDTMKNAGKKAANAFMKGFNWIKNKITGLFSKIWTTIKVSAIVTIAAIMRTMYRMFQDYGGYIERSISEFGSAGGIAAEEIIKINKEMRYIG